MFRNWCKNSKKGLNIGRKKWCEYLEKKLRAKIRSLHVKNWRKKNCAIISKILNLKFEDKIRSNSIWKVEKIGAKFFRQNWLKTQKMAWT